MKSCKLCGASFTPKSKGLKIYCSPECSKEARRIGVKNNVADYRDRKRFEPWLEPVDLAELLAELQDHRFGIDKSEGVHNVYSEYFSADYYIHDYEEMYDTLKELENEDDKQDN